MGVTVGVIGIAGADDVRVPLVPKDVGVLAKVGASVVVQRGIGDALGHGDAVYAESGATVGSVEECVACDVVLALDAHSNGALSGGCRGVVVGYWEPYGTLGSHDAMCNAGGSACAVELVPRITRAQSMDVLSSMANIAGYKAVLVAAERIARMFPLMMTAAGTVVPCKVLVIGAGVAGLQAIATAKRLGGVLSGYDIRAQVKDQIESLGATFVELPIEQQESGDSGGYAKEMSKEFLARQQQLLADAVAEHDVVICTAAVPGRPAPKIVSKAMVERMSAGSVIVDIAAPRGGNCEVTELGKSVQHAGVTIIGPADLAATVPFTASSLYSGNMVQIVKHLVHEGELVVDLEDEITTGMLFIDRGTRREPGQPTGQSAASSQANERPGNHLGEKHPGSTTGGGATIDK